MPYFPGNQSPRLASFACLLVISVILIISPYWEQSFQIADVFEDEKEKDHNMCICVCVCVRHRSDTKSQYVSREKGTLETQSNEV